ncbi:hypothetical protein PIB30_013357 [Stylosanthes scabra]|uniref:Uncharacterized protein n=1 Tax=Stylosanthes scabra TaxID=79078 RepID=A0ABU6V782_9FABA|nr:hypothetical protein [Stylosanthes scabra]
MQISEKAFQPSTGELVGFSSERIPILGYVWLRTTLGEPPNSRTLDVQYLNNRIATVHADHTRARKCYNTSLTMSSEDKPKSTNPICKQNTFKQLGNPNQRSK